MKTYITKLVKGSFVSYNEEIDAEYWAGKIGTTYEDYLDGKWVLLSDEQAAFHEEHPELSPYYVWNMEMPPVYVRTLEDAKREMNDMINSYDNSDEVNAFIVKIPSDSEEAVDGFVEMKAWLTPQERSNYRSSVDSAKLLEIDTLSLYIGDMPLTLSTSTAERMLAHIQLYADQCFIVTKQHKADVEALTTIEEVDSYDYRTGYPEMLVFAVEAQG